MMTAKQDPTTPGLQSTPRSQELISLAIIRIHDRVLPTESALRLFAGPSADSCCSLCNRSIAQGEIEYEATSLSGNATPTFYFHVACYHAWRDAARRIARPESGLAD